MRKNKLFKLIIIGCMTVLALTACGGKKESFGTKKRISLSA